MKQFHLCLTTVKIAYTPVKELECIQEAEMMGLVVGRAASYGMP